MAQLVPYLQFKGNCAEAMTFYKDCLDAKLDLMTVGGSQMAADMPKEAHDKIMHSTLEKGDFTLMASDMFDDSPANQGNTVALCLICKSKDEIESSFAKLSAGGHVTHPLKEEFFGTFGDLTDKYGFNWMFQFDGKAKP